ncbi:unnamed protein product [Schistosoma turkestanicum]|nr:unnamed protein product [Schistosoma turkestanicum]
MIDLNTNGQAICTSVNCVLEGKWSWVIFGYMGLTHTLDVKNQGHDLNQFLNEFSPGKVLYGFIRVESMTPAKFVLIVWQGEASSESFKIACARHIDCVKRLCRTVHVTINARTEADLDWNEIIIKLQNLTGSISKSRPSIGYKPDDEVIPTGSVYVRANPNIDIPKGCVSQSIWQSQQQKQQNSPKLVSPVESKPGNFVRPVCEPEINHNHLQSENESQNAVKQIAPDEMTNTVKSRIRALESKMPLNETTSSYRKVDPRAEIMLAKQLSSLNGKDDDEDDANPVGTNYKKLDPKSEIMAARACKQSEEYTFISNKPFGNHQKQPDVQSEIPAVKATTNSNSLSSTYKKSDDVMNNSSTSEDFSPHQNGHHDHHQSSAGQTKQQTLQPLSLAPLAHISNNQFHSDLNQQSNNTNNGQYYQNHNLSTNSMHEQDSSPSYNISPSMNSHEKTGEKSNLKAICLYDYTANEEDELSFRYGEQIVEIEQVDEGWWLGRNADNQYGLFPSNYVELLDDDTTDH